MSSIIDQYVEEIEFKLKNIRYHKKQDIGHMDSDCLLREYRDGEMFFIRVVDFIDRASYEYILLVLEEIILAGQFGILKRQRPS